MSLDGIKRILDDFDEIYGDYQLSARVDMLLKFLAKRAAQEYRYISFQEKAPDNDAVQIMTVHKAKGLEFHTVFLPELTKNEFPARTLGGKQYYHVLNKLSCYSSSYVSKFASLMNGIFRNAVSNGALIRNPMAGVQRPKCKKTGGHRCLEPWERALIRSTWQEHDFGLAAMVMLYTGFRRGEMLHLNIDRDVDFEKKTIAVRGAVSFSEGNRPKLTKGKTASAIRTVPLLPPLEEALKGRHGLVCHKENGGIMSQSAFACKYESYITFLETKLNGIHKRWYGKTNEQKQLLAEGKLPPWKEINIRCHDFRVEFCTRAYYAQVPLKTLQSWMGHADADMILAIYTKLDKEQERTDAAKMVNYLTRLEVDSAAE